MGIPRSLPKTGPWIAEKTPRRSWTVYAPFSKLGDGRLSRTPRSFGLSGDASFKCPISAAIMSGAAARRCDQHELVRLKGECHEGQTICDPWLCRFSRVGCLGRDACRISSDRGGDEHRQFVHCPGCRSEHWQLWAGVPRFRLRAARLGCHELVRFFFHQSRPVKLLDWRVGGRSERGYRDRRGASVVEPGQPQHSGWPIFHAHRVSGRFRSLRRRNPISDGLEHSGRLGHHRIGIVDQHSPQPIARMM